MRAGAMTVALHSLGEIVSSINTRLCSRMGKK